MHIAVKTKHNYISDLEDAADFTCLTLSSVGTENTYYPYKSISALQD